ATGVRDVQAEQPKAQSEAGVWMIVTYKVYEFERWQRQHERSASAKRNYGWQSCAVLAVDGDRNHVMVMEHFSTLERAQAYANSAELRDEMAASGVSTEPEIRFAKSLAGEPAVATAR